MSEPARRRVTAFGINNEVIFDSEEIAPDQWLFTEPGMSGLGRQTWQGLISWLDRLIIPGRNGAPGKAARIEIQPEYDAVIIDSTGHAWRGADYMDSPRWLVSLVPEERRPHG
jgi:hypothetical protein